ncbi:B-box zinc finger protein 32-like [Silene latifolia]|uniref:B-box zinc finger protein 32-like n=1 Tax=Silene latifolia TaxID=37657 RepID=UPI003D77F8DD
MAEFKITQKCELCNNDADVFCSPDNAYLCLSCDDQVHRANFLVARHIRARYCTHCRRFAGNIVSGFKTPVTCQSCSRHVHHVDDDGDCLSSSSSCVSSTTTCDDTASSTTARKVARAVDVVARETVVDGRVEGILVNWSRRMGVEERKVVKVAAEVVTAWRMDKMTVVPLRVVLAAALWVGIRVRVRVSGGNCGGGELLRRLEQISGVPVKLILIMGSRLARVVKCRGSRVDDQEGSAES